MSDPTDLTTYPVPSQSFVPAARNAEDFDSIINGDGVVQTRTGKNINSISRQLESLGYQPPVDYAAGIAFGTNDTTKTIEREGIVYAPIIDELPFTTTGTWTSSDEDKFKAVQLNDEQVGLFYDRSKNIVRSIYLSGNVEGSFVRDLANDAVEVALNYKIIHSFYSDAHEASSGGVWTCIDTAAAEPSGSPANINNRKIYYPSDGRLNLFVETSTDDVFYEFKLEEQNFTTICAVVRRDTSISPDWQYIDDDFHVPIGFDTVVGPVVDGDFLDLDQNQNKRNGATIVAPDETFASKGIFCGASSVMSGSPDKTRIKMASTFTADVTLSDTPTVSTDTHPWFASKVSIVWSSQGYFLVTHPATQDFSMMTIVKNQRSLTVVDVTFQLERVNAVSTRIYTIANLSGRLYYDGSDWQVESKETAILGSAAAAGFTATWDSGNSRIRLQHPEVMQNEPLLCQIEGSSNTLIPYTIGANGNRDEFSVVFRDAANSMNVETTESSDMSIHFTRGRYILDNPWGITATINFPVSVIDPAVVDSDSGNLWTLQSHRPINWG